MIDRLVKFSLVPVTILTLVLNTVSHNFPISHKRRHHYFHFTNEERLREV
jgi:hypothetical protein